MRGEFNDIIQLRLTNSLTMICVNLILINLKEMSYFINK